MANAGNGRAVSWVLRQLDSMYGLALRGTLLCTDCGDCSHLIYSMHGVKGVVLPGAPQSVRALFLPFSEFESLGVWEFVP